MPLLFLMTAILLLSLVLRFYRLGSRPLYGDEPQNTVEVANRPLSFIVSTNYGSTLYPLILHFLLPLGNVGVMSRLPAAILGLLSIWGIFIVGRRILSLREAVIAAFLGAVSTPFIYLSQQARAYTGFLFFSLLALYFYWRALKEDKRLLWALYALSMIIGSYANFFLLVTLPIYGLYALFLAVEKKISLKTFFLFLLSGGLSVCVTVLIYWPTRTAATDAFVGPNFIYLMKNGLASLFRSRWNVNPFSLFCETVQRQLDYFTQPLLFYVNVGLAVLGVAFYLGRQRREGFFLLSYFILPFFFFALSNPPLVYWSAQDNKFIFILPVMYLLMAKGLTGIYGAAIRGLGKLGPSTVTRSLRLACAGLLIAGVMVLESLYLLDYRFSFWHLRSLNRNPAVDSYLREKVMAPDMIFSEDYLNKEDVILVKPLDGIRQAKKMIMIFEGGQGSCDFFASTNTGLWVLVPDKILPDEEISSLRDSFPEIEIKYFPRHALIHLPGGSRTLLARFDAILKVLIRISGHQEKSLEYDLLAARLDLCAGRVPEALKKIEATAKMTDRSVVQRGLSRRVVEVLIDMAERSKDKQNTKESLIFLDAASHLDPSFCESSMWFHMLRASSYVQAGSKADALAEYKKALLLCHDEDNLGQIIKMIGRDLSLPSGCILWQDKDICQVRWWGETKTTMTGSLTSSFPLNKVAGIHFASDDFYRQRRDTVVFESAVAKGRIKGLTIKTRKGSRLAASIKINGRKETGERIVCLLDDVKPIADPEKPISF